MQAHMPRLPRLLWLLVSALALGCGGGSVQAGGGGGNGGGGGTGGAGLPTPDHVFVILLENHSFSQVIGSPSMPYLNSLAAQNSLAANYFANVHPSIGNYFMLTTGVIESTDDAFSGTVTDDNLARALAGAGKTWKSYMESLPSPGYLGGDVLPYVRHHNPFTYFSDVRQSTAQAANIVPFSQLGADMASNALPDFGFIAPNIRNDAHDCPSGGSACADSLKLSTADAWLQNNIDPMIKSPAFANSLLIIVFDEGLDTDTANGGGQVPMVMLGTHVRTAFRSTTLYQHQSVLRLVLELLRVSDRPGASATAPSMAEFFQ